MTQATRDRLTALAMGCAAFCAYFAMYAFRKPIAAASFADVAGWGAVGYKSLLVIAQVAGYALSKLLGIKVISEFGREGRARAILLLIAAAWMALVLLALVPAPLGPLCLFLNGLPLGLIWGLVFSFVEGRRTSELIGAMLCASFIVASGVVKSVAVLLMRAGVSAWWMPAATGALFAPLLILSVAVLARMPPPSIADERARVRRVPMTAEARRHFLRAHGLPMLLLVLGYVLLTAVRDLRDNFAAEIWAGLGYAGEARMFSESELPVGAIVLGALACLVLVRSNGRALMLMHGAVIAGALLLGCSTVAFRMGALSPLPWMILSGAGLYLAYTPFNAMLFDRLIAYFGSPGNAGFLIYVADASGYVGSVALLLWRSLGTPHLDWLGFFITACEASAVAVALLTAGSAIWFALAGARRRVAPAPITAALSG